MNSYKSTRGLTPQVSVEHLFKVNGEGEWMVRQHGAPNIVATRDAALAQGVRPLGNTVSHVKYLNEIKGDNARLGDLQAACLRVTSGMGRPPLDSGLIRAAASVA